ncbi:PRC-barrel domain-containing protein [Myxococcus sp. MxC21-1]|uniref:PRC-barrel domain-containing protein n=1 Tax=Myxococcus sp. MxC21-1 TaxID=3041439 RepID=UPI00292CB415|nr:PRC-barrel domain-containing protein [Myxococcus sp. MxC21-1]WNZ60865.1 PRC-barrel domain-containing protein [Myxococcus sp. MxC21-1]
MRFSERIRPGRTVVASGGQQIGVVEALSIDSETWKVEGLQVKLRSEAADQIGAFWNFFHAGRVELPTHIVQSVSDTVVLSVSVDELRQVLPLESTQRSHEAQPERRNHST